MKPRPLVLIEARRIRVEHAVLSQAAVLTRIKSIQTHCLSLYVRDLMLLNEATHVSGAADELSSEVDHGCERF